MKTRDPRWLLVLLANLLLAWLAGVANHLLAPAGVSLYFGGLFVAFAGLRLDARHGLVATLLTGLALDAGAPVPFGTHAALLGLVYATLLQGRHRFPREEPVFATVVVLFANLFLFLALSFLLISESPRPASTWLRLFVDLLCSQLTLALITPWFFALLARVFALARLHPETGRHVEA